MRHIYTSLDIGSSSIKLMVAEVYREKVNVLCTKEEKCKGIKKGLIVNAEETLSTIRNIVKDAEEITKLKISKVIVSIPLYNVEFVKGEGYTTVTREDKILNGDDIVRSLQASAYNRIPNDKELVSIMPLSFIIDDEKKVKDPKGIHADKLSVVSVMGITPKKNVYSVVKLIEGLGLKVIDITFNGIADYYAFLEEKYENVTGAVINIGHEKTEVSIIHKGVLINSEVIPYGGKNADKDIAYEYDITTSAARVLRETFGLASQNNASTADSEIITNKDGKNIRINQYELSMVINKRIKEILELAKKQINLLTKKQISYIIITGGLSETRDFKIVYEEVLGKSIVPNALKVIGARNNKFSPCLGMIKYYHSKLKFRNKISSMIEEDEETEDRRKNKKDNNKVIDILKDYFFD